MIQKQFAILNRLTKKFVESRRGHFAFNTKSAASNAIRYAYASKEDCEVVPAVLVSADEYESMQEDVRWLAALDAAGVDNWSGCDFAADILREWNDN
ncbi:hypothetical protein [Shimia sp.]|uniref:hypothetical protein n=1 Tax=Shimia sp. TaxID=1954381 RepID=UPI003BA8C0B4